MEEIQRELARRRQAVAEEVSEEQKRWDANAKFRLESR